MSVYMQVYTTLAWNPQLSTSLEISTFVYALHVRLNANLHIHDQDYKQAFGTLTSGVRTYVPLRILANSYILVFGYHFLAQTDTSPLTNSKS